MDIKIYNNTVMVPVKCGSRYLDKIWESERIKFNHFEYLEFPKVKYIVVRDPMSHLITALHTEILVFINETGESNNFNHKLKDFVSPHGVTHWCVRFYEYFYYYKKKYGEDIQVVKLDNLTELLQNLGYNIEYTPYDYQFKKYKIWWSKEELFEILKNTYPNEINWLIDKVKIQNVYYNKLLNNNVDII
jgi:hypothetical protein